MDEDQKTISDFLRNTAADLDQSAQELRLEMWRKQEDLRSKRFDFLLQISSFSLVIIGVIAVLKPELIRHFSLLYASLSLLTLLVMFLVYTLRWKLDDEQKMYEEMSKQFPGSLAKVAAFAREKLRSGPPWKTEYIRQVVDFHKKIAEDLEKTRPPSNAPLDYMGEFSIFCFFASIVSFAFSLASLSAGHLWVSYSLSVVIVWVVSFNDFLPRWIYMKINTICHYYKTVFLK